MVGFRLFQWASLANQEVADTQATSSIRSDTLLRCTSEAQGGQLGLSTLVSIGVGPRPNLSIFRAPRIEGERIVLHKISDWKSPNLPFSPKDFAGPRILDVQDQIETGHAEHEEDSRLEAA